MSGKIMTLLGAKSFPFSSLFLAFVVKCSVCSEDNCYRFRRKENVTIDTDQCLWENFTEPRPKRFCLYSCINNATCTGMVMVKKETSEQCCFLDQTEIEYRQPGNQTLFYWKHAELQCQKKWTGDNCDLCTESWSGTNCDACSPGWTGNDCDTCNDGWLPPTCDQICDGFGCCNHSNCQGCIQNGRWETTSGYEVHLTFGGKKCSDLVPGTGTAIYTSSGTISGGTLDEATNTLSFNDGTYTYEGTIAEDKTFSTTQLIFSYVYPTAK